MKKKFCLISFCFLMIFLIKNKADAQDIHYSQFYNSPLNINPALTGIFNGDARITGSLRNQWNTQSPYTTFSTSYDTRILPKSSDKLFYGIGGLLNYDQAGDGNLNVTGLNAAGSITYMINKNNLLTGGLLLGVATEGFNPSQLTWSTQWTGETVDLTLGSQEGFGNTERVTYLETGVGVNYRYQMDSSRTNLNLGVGLFHLTQPNNGYIDLGNPRLPLRTSINAVANIQLSSDFDIQVHGQGQFQGPYNDFLVGGLLMYYLNNQRGKNLRIDGGATYRTSGYIMPTLAFAWREFYLSLSYDVNLSPFNDDFSSRRGGPEIHFRYIMTKVKTVANKPCPIY